MLTLQVQEVWLGNREPTQQRDCDKQTGTDEEEGAAYTGEEGGGANHPQVEDRCYELDR